MSGIRAVSASELLNAWEMGRQRPPLDQAILLLLLAFPELTAESVKSLPLGKKDALLLQLRDQLFGERLDSVASCPACGEALEFSFDVHDFGLNDYPKLPETTEISVDEFELVVRLPTTADVRDAAGHGEQIFSQILLQATHQGESITADKVPDDIRESVAQRLQALDPLMDVRLALSCPACDHQWQALFDISSYLWREIDQWARRTLQTVHMLASGYGWREQDVLSMSAWRRQYYVELLSR